MDEQTTQIDDAWKSRRRSRRRRRERVPLRDLEDGQRVRGVYAVRERELRRKRNGEPWLRLTLGDASGTAEAVAWEDAEALYALAAPGSAVFVTGVFEVSERWGAKIKLAALREARAGRVRDGRTGAASSDVAVDRLESRPARAARRRSRTPSCASCSTPSSARAREIWARFRDAPAAKVYHQAYRHGLLEHTLSVAQAVSRRRQLLPRHRPRRRRHRRPPARHRQDRGLQRRPAGDRPHRRSAACRARSRSATTWCAAGSRTSPASTPASPRRVLHIILSHHGSLEHGSPVVPATREAVLVHMIDNLGGRLGSFDRLERELPAGESWSGFDRALSGSAYFGQRAA